MEAMDGEAAPSRFVKAALLEGDGVVLWRCEGTVATSCLSASLPKSSDANGAVPAPCCWRSTADGPPALEPSGAPLFTPGVAAGASMLVLRTAGDIVAGGGIRGTPAAGPHAWHRRAPASTGFTQLEEVGVVSW